MSSVQHIVYFCLALVLLALCLHNAEAATQSSMCEPGIVDSLPMHIRKVCLALENSDQLSTMLRSYLSNEASALVANSDDLLRNYNKRTDVDHVFLRFGKRR